MKTRLVTLVIIASVIIFPNAAAADPIDVTVRIEGSKSTLFERSITTDGHEVKSLSDGLAHPCDGRNHHANDTPGATPTAALDDAARLGSFDWDGVWKPRFEDFFIWRIGKDEDPDSDFAWSLRINGKLAKKAGCQVRLQPGDEVLWAFGPGRPLRLIGPTAAVVGTPTVLKIIDGGTEAGVEGAKLSPLNDTSTNGLPGTNLNGEVSITFDQPGIKVFKATLPGAIRSNSLAISVGQKPQQSSRATGRKAENTSLKSVPSLESSVAYLQKRQNSDGGFSEFNETNSDPALTAWATLALASAGIDPVDQHLPGKQSSLDYLINNPADESSTTDLDRLLLALTTTSSPKGESLAARLSNTLLTRQLPNGSFSASAGGKTGSISTTIFSILALASSQKQGLGSVIKKASSWLEGKQGAKGEFDPGAFQVDMTAAAIQALVSASRSRDGNDRTKPQPLRRKNAVIDRAVGFIRSAQNPDGGFPTSPGDESNSSSTAWVAQALWAAGVDPASLMNNPLTYLISMRKPDGSMKQSTTTDAATAWVTAYTIPALTGRALPIGKVAKKQPNAPNTHSKPNPQSSVLFAGKPDQLAPLFASPGQARGNSTPPRSLTKRKSRESSSFQQSKPRQDTMRPRWVFQDGRLAVEHRPIEHDRSDSVTNPKRRPGNEVQSQKKRAGESVTGVPINQTTSRASNNLGLNQERSNKGLLAAMGVSLLCLLAGTIFEIKVML